jgi:hypothetical protein
MARRLLAASLVVICAVLGSAAPAMAHVQASNNGVSAVMHIVPDDSPVAGKPTLVSFSFGGQASDFDIASCGCRLQVFSGSRTISDASVEPVDQTSSSGQVSVTFPKQGVYDLRLSGKIGEQTGRSFAIKFAVRVDPASGTADAAGGMNVIFISLASLVVVGIVAYYNISNGGRYDSPQPDKPRRK